MKKVFKLVMLTIFACMMFSCIDDEQNKETSKAQDEPKPEYFYTYDILWYYPIFYYDKLAGERDSIIIIKNGDNPKNKSAIFGGLAIKLACRIPTNSTDGNSVKEVYLRFDNEANYDSEIFAWRLAYNIGHDLFEWNKDHKYINGEGHISFKTNLDELTHCLSEIRYLPNIVDTNMNNEIIEIFKRNYYDLKEKPIYPPEKGYGYRKYPLEFERNGMIKNSIKLTQYNKLERLGLVYSPTKKAEGIPDDAIIITGHWGGLY
ncbi:MAG: hypothetical protein IKU05_05260 [Bacteroidales bacterium]|nr:hypothetical protein [Bacteroidales bacterium]MBR6438011.1 hypothetical protein [Bacteroidales bacterium]